MPSLVPGIQEDWLGVEDLHGYCWRSIIGKSYSVCEIILSRLRDPRTNMSENSSGIISKTLFEIGSGIISEVTTDSCGPFRLGHVRWSLRIRNCNFHRTKVEPSREHMSVSTVIMETTNTSYEFYTWYLTKGAYRGNHPRLGVHPEFTMGGDGKYGERKSGFLKPQWLSSQALSTGHRLLTPDEVIRDLGTRKDGCGLLVEPCKGWESLFRNRGSLGRPGSLVLSVNT